VFEEYYPDEVGDIMAAARRLKALDYSMQYRIACAPFLDPGEATQLLKDIDRMAQVVDPPGDHRSERLDRGALQALRSRLALKRRTRKG